MADNMPGRGQLGRVDASLSHKRHDDEADKWNSLQAWRIEFKAHHLHRNCVGTDQFGVIGSFLALGLARPSRLYHLGIVSGSGHVGVVWEGLFIVSGYGHGASASSLRRY
jgi:hypothetical protein